MHTRGRPASLPADAGPVVNIGPAVAEDRTIELVDVHKTFRLSKGTNVEALRGLSLNVRRGEFVAIIGPSGCGKSTALRLLAGLEEADRGTVRLIAETPREVVREGRLGVAFQEHALLPWLSTWGNIALPFKVTGRREDRDQITQLLELVGLTGFEKARPKHLSGGMRQRVAIARALALDPDILLLDEPFGALDSITRASMQAWLADGLAEEPRTVLLVTHDVQEALYLADRVVVLSPRPGRVVAELDVELPRPRDRREIVTDPQFARLERSALEALEQ
jgi:NitT/TauT family transport system ATP-binding protein